MPSRQLRFPWRAAVAAAAALGALSVAASAKDLPADARRGAEDQAPFSPPISAKAAGAPAALAVTPEASDYAVVVRPRRADGAVQGGRRHLRSRDHASSSCSSRTTAPGASSTPSFRRSSSHTNEGRSDRDRVDRLQGRNTWSIPPSPGVRSGRRRRQARACRSHGPGRRRSVEAGALQAMTGAAQAASDGAVSSALQESVADRRRALHRSTPGGRASRRRRASRSISPPTPTRRPSTRRSTA